jgi:CTP:molybdopterin cytidylyltransferase MocA
VLAAGRSTRFDGVKQVAPLGDRPLVRWAVDAALASGLRPVVTVVGNRAGAIEAVLPPGVDVVKARRASQGISQSLRALVTALDGWVQIGAVCVGLGDQPHVGAEAYRRLAQAYDAGATFAVATYAGQRQNPVLIARPLWPRVRELRGDVGARALMPEVAVTEVDCTDTGSPADVDTPADLERMAREMES